MQVMTCKCSPTKLVGSSDETLIDWDSKQLKKVLEF